MDHAYGKPERGRAEVDTLPGPTVLEFGTAWCGFCQAAQPLLVAAFADYPEVRHIKVTDGKGLPLGRSFRVKLWPTLVFLKDGKEVARAVRPADEDEVRRGLEAIAGTPV